MRSTSMVIDPQSKDCWLLAGDGDEGTRAAIFRSKALAHGFNLNRWSKKSKSSATQPERGKPLGIFSVADGF